MLLTQTLVPHNPFLARRLLVDSYNIELEADGDLVITWDRSHRFTVTQPRDIIFTGGMTHIAVVHTPSGAGRGITV